MRKLAIFSASFLALTLSACGSGFYGPPKPVRLSHIDGSTQSGTFVCDDGDLKDPKAEGNEVERFNLGYNFSKKVCAALYDERDQDTVQEMVNSGVTLVRTRCSDFFAAKQTNQGRARLIRSLIQPLTVAITSTFAVINFGGEGENRQSDALALLAAGNALATAGLDIYEDQFLFGAENVHQVQAMTMRALSAHQADIFAADLDNFDAGVRSLLDHQAICTPGYILELVRLSIAAGDFRPRQPTGQGPGIQSDGAQNAIELPSPSVRDAEGGS